MLVRFLFVSLAAFLTAQTPFRFVAIGDTGSASPAQGRIADQMWQWREKNPFDLILMLGDNIYGATELMHGGDPKLFLLQNLDARFVQHHPVVTFSRQNPR